MGWTFFHKGNRTTREAVLGEITWNHLPEEERPAIVEAASKGNVWSIAVRYPAVYVQKHKMEEIYKPSEDGSVIAALVFLVQSAKKDYHDFGYKDMDECMGPYQAGPTSILKLLSPLQEDNSDKEYSSIKNAKAWRDRCVAASNAEAKMRKQLKALVPGVSVKLPEALTFENFKEDKFVFVSKMGVKLVFRAQNGCLVRLVARHLENATIG